MCDGERMKAPSSLSVVVAMAWASWLLSMSVAHAGAFCDPAVREYARIRLEQAAPSPQATANDLTAAEHAVAQALRMQRDAGAGRDLEEPYGGAAYWGRQAASAASPRLAELFRRVAEDQAIRSHGVVTGRGLLWAAGLSERVRDYVQLVLTTDNCAVDEDNTAWLKTQLSQGGWFTISTAGEAADEAAFLLVQHADHDPAFQAEILGKLEPLARRGETAPKRYAMLFDRVAVAAKRPQRFGTQGRCQPGGKWVANDIETPEALDARRAAFGLEPEAVYVPIVARLCPL